jgi:hypothetical protein
MLFSSGLIITGIQYACKSVNQINVSQTGVRRGVSGVPRRKCVMVEEFVG